jgi:hypothetical protein
VPYSYRRLTEDAWQGGWVAMKRSIGVKNRAVAPRRTKAESTAIGDMNGFAVASYKLVDRQNYSL